MVNPIRSLLQTLSFLLSATSLLAQQPFISAIQNNYSFTLPNLPNYGIAPGSLFVIYGSNLSTVSVPVLQSSAAPGVPLSLNGVSVSASVNGVTAAVPLYYVSTGQIAGVLPSTVPPGKGTIIVTNNGQVSQPATLQVVAGDFGILTTNNAGHGSAAVYDAQNKLISSSNSVSPGQTIVIYGSGVGADPGNNDRVFPQKQNNLTNIPTEVLIGGTSAAVLYRGRSQFPGVDQINVVVPAVVGAGCNVSLVVQSANYVSNSTTLAVAPNGGSCSDPNTDFTPAQLASLRNKSSVKVGTLFIEQMTAVARNLVRNVVRGRFLNYTQAQFATKPLSDSSISYGSCQVSVTTNVRITHFSAGSSLTLSGPGGQTATALFTTLKDGTGGEYRGTLPAGFIPNGGGTFLFNNGSGSNAVGPFTTPSLFVSQPLSWTNRNAISSVNRTQGLTVTWSGGANGTFVLVRGSAVAGTDVVAFSCAVPVTAGKFTIPPSILLAMPPVNGDLVLSNITLPVLFSAPGLDLGTVFAEIGATIPVSYQ